MDVYFAAASAVTQLNRSKFQTNQNVNSGTRLLPMISSDNLLNEDKLYIFGECAQMMKDHIVEIKKFSSSKVKKIAVGQRHLVVLLGSKVKRKQRSPRLRFEQ